MKLQVLAMILQSALGASLAAAAEVQPAAQSEIRRGVAAVGARPSDEPALRLERQTRTPSDFFMIGSAMAAWSNAAASLKLHLATPTGDGGDAELIDEDCYDERIAFGHLESRRQSAGLTPAQIAAAAGAPSQVPPSWAARQSAAPAACR